MDPLDYFERESNRTFTTLMSDFTGFHERTYKLITLLVGGGGGASAYLLAKLADARPMPPEWWAIFALAASWFLIAGALLVAGLKSFKLSSGATPGTLGALYVSKSGDETGLDTEANRTALLATRWAELRTMDDRISKFRDAIDWRARWLGGAYFAAALSPVAASIALWVASRWA